ncbi:MAG: hypothetical protein HQK91_00655 [Nitrospirae bacterium]|nr:hypothetical protein [Nitrospirota bacterium]MBF0539947.1 hypothetical protein [Nitrospirota bacterium]
MGQHRFCCPHLKEMSWYKCVKLLDPNITSHFRLRNIPTCQHLISYCETEQYFKCSLFGLIPLYDGMIINKESITAKEVFRNENKRHV